MTCPHADTTTLRWLYGELDDEAHAAHVAGCPDCQAACDAHLDVLGALPDAPRSAATAPARDNPWRIAGPLLAAAAALFVVLLPSSTPEAPPPEAVAFADPSLSLSLLVDDPLDDRLDALDAELLALRLDLSDAPEVP